MGHIKLMNEQKSKGLI